MKKAKRIPAGITQPDILMEILSCLPVKSLLRFRCVSKTWLDLISSPHFVKLHTNRSIQINPKILFSTDDDIFTIDYRTPPPYHLERNDFPQYEDQLIRGSCNGLLCMSDNEGYMSLWNPSAREYVDIPYPYESLLRGCGRDVVVGFGYDSVLGEYKIVRSVFSFRDFKPTECDVAVCTLGTGHWRTVDDPPCCLRDRHAAPLVNGALHWLGGTPIGGSNVPGHKIVSFDIRSEEFRVVPWIDTVMDIGYDITIGVLRGCLSALVPSAGDSGIDVWTMKDYGVKESWMKLLSVQMPSDDIEFSSVELMVWRENGELILKSEGELYIYDGIDHVLASTYDIYDDDPSSGDEGRVYGESDDDSPSCHAGYIYAESLVSIESLVGQQTDEDLPWYKTGSGTVSEENEAQWEGLYWK